MAIHELNDDGVGFGDGGERSEPAVVAPPQSRFLFVDVAALRAKQLRRGALARLGAVGDTHYPIKAERIAMEETRRGLVGYDLPEFKPAAATEQ
jgi:DNA-directed RNA polymerase subunit K/omega